MRSICVCGAGNIGRFVGVLLARTKDYRVTLVDLQDPDAQLLQLCKRYPNLHFQQLSVSDTAAMDAFFTAGHFSAVIACLHSELNVMIAQHALKHKAHYLNLSEDREARVAIAALAEGAQTAFVLQCGVAPGLVDVIAHNMMQSFDTLQSATLSVGALPQQVNNTLHYELSWSIDGLVNEYLNPSKILEQGQVTEVPALSGLEVLDIDGNRYEMFHTSGGLGSLGNFYQGKIQSMCYKTIRYAGHCAEITKLFAEHHNDRDALVAWFRDNIPFTSQDVVLMYIAVTGMLDGVLKETSFLHKWYPQTLDTINWTAIQWVTASEVCALCDMIIFDAVSYNGLVEHQDVDYSTLLGNRFMRYYAL